MSADSWFAAVAAARAKQRPLYWVETLFGTTAEVTTTLEAAKLFVGGSKFPRHYRIYKQQNGNLYEVKP